MTTSINSALKCTARQAYEIGSDAYCYFYPLVTMDVTRRQMTNLPPGKKPGYGPVNKFSHTRGYPEADFKVVVRPNFDTLYSCAWLDISNEPVIVSIPDTSGRYYLLPMLDMWTDVFASPGWRTSGTTAQDYAIVPQGWSGKIPQGIARIDAPTCHVWIIGRIQTNGPDDYEAVHKIQDGMVITPLSLWGKNATEAVQEIDNEIDMNTPPLEFVNSLSPLQFFKRASELIEQYHPHVTDWSLLARLKQLGFETGEEFVLENLDEDIKNDFARGAQSALELMKANLTTVGRIKDGWSINTDTMGVYGNYYLKRAIVAMAGLGANQPEDAVYPINFADSNGKPLVGEKKYVLRFKKDELPPVNAFWSVTMYDADGFQVANQINRFAVSSWMPLKTNSDGSIDIYIQNERPTTEKESNWLPAPSTGTLGITMRLYAPEASVLIGKWMPPAIVEVD